MTREFVYTAPFQRSWKAMGLDDNDQKLLEEALLKNPPMPAAPDMGGMY
jgi:hypothetical protein